MRFVEPLVNSMITQHEFNITPRFDIGYALDKLFGVIGGDFLFPAVDCRLAGIVSSKGFEPIVGISLQQIFEILSTESDIDFRLKQRFV